MDSRNTVFIFNRAENSWPAGGYANLKPISSPAVIGFDGATGKVLFSWGQGQFKHPHGLRIDDRDNLWLTDDILQQVFKISRDGKLLLSIGTADSIGCDATHFNGPTGVAVAPDGSFYVADGYVSSRIAKFSADGGSDNSLYVVDGGDLADGPSMSGRPFREAIMIIDHSGKVLEKWSGFGNQDGLIFWGHDIAVGADAAVYVGDVYYGMRVQKFVRTRR